MSNARGHVRGAGMFLMLPSRDYPLAIAAGILLGIGFVIPALWWTSLVSFTPFLYALSLKRSSVSRTFALGLLFGAVAYGLSFSTTFWTTFPLTWVGIDETWIALLVIGIMWGSTVLVFSLCAGAYALFVRLLARDSWSDIALASAGWVFVDWLGAWLFSFVNASSGMLYGPHFTMGSFGYLLADDTVLLQAAWLGGLFALNALIAGVGALFYRLVRTKSAHERLALSLITVLGLLLFVGGQIFISRIPAQARAAGAPLDVALVSTHIPAKLSPSREEFDARFARMAALVGSIEEADVIALPEGSGFLERLRDTHGSLVNILAPKLREKADGLLFIDSAVARESDGELRSRIEYRNVGAWRSSFAYKEFLFPFGEALPKYYYWLADILDRETILANFLHERKYGKGKVPEPVQARTGARVVALLCSDGVSPFLYRKQVAVGAEVLFNLSSHAWFHNSYAMHMVGLRMAKVRAAESRRYLALSGNIIPSFIIDPYGRLVAASERDSEGILKGRVYPRTDSTPYTMLGEGVLAISLGVLILSSMRRFGKTQV